jgi:hypothetical protein
MFDSFEVVGLALLGLLSIGFVVREAVVRPRRASRADASALPVPLADVKPGPVHTAGLVGVGDVAKHAPLGAPLCTFYRVVVEALHEPGKVLFEGRSADDITLDDGSGTKLTVHLDSAKWLVSRKRERVSLWSSPDADVVQFLTERGLSCAPVRVRVEWVGPHELVFVRGVAKETLDGSDGYRTRGHRTLEMDKEHPVVIGLDPLGEDVR